MNREDTGKTEEREETPKISSEKPTVRKRVNITIKHVDGHFLAHFDLEGKRIFHNMEELLAAIEVEAGKLTVSS